MPHTTQNINTSRDGNDDSGSKIMGLIAIIAKDYFTNRTVSLHYGP